MRGYSIHWFVAFCVPMYVFVWNLLYFTHIEQHMVP